MVLRRTQNHYNFGDIFYTARMLRPIRTTPPNRGQKYGIGCEDQDDQHIAERAFTSTTKTPATWAQNLSLVLRRTHNPHKHGTIVFEKSMLSPICTASPNLGPSYALVCDKHDEEYGALTSTTKTHPTS